MCYYDLLWLTEYWLLCWLFCVHDISASMKALSLAWRYATVSCHSWQPASVNRKSAFLTRSTSLYKSNEPRPNTTKFLSSEDLCAQNQLLTFLARKPGDTICSYFCRYSFTKNQLVQWKIGCPRWRRFISFTSWSLLNHDFKSVNPTHVRNNPGPAANLSWKWVTMSSGSVLQGESLTTCEGCMACSTQPPTFFRSHQPMVTNDQGVPF